MKARRLAGLILALFLISGFVFAEAEAEKVKKSEKPEVKRIDPKTRSMAPRGFRPDRSQMRRERMQKQVETHKAALKELAVIKKIAEVEAHQAALKELADIKKIAEEEGATKTAEALQKLIDKKDTKFKKDLQKFEKARKERSLKLQEKTKAKLKKNNSEVEKKVEKTVEDKAEEK